MPLSNFLRLKALSDTGLVRYRFDKALRTVILNSSIFARIRAEVTFALSSKYALALYEMVQKRGNLSFRWSETFDWSDRLIYLVLAPGVDPEAIPQKVYELIGGVRGPEATFAGLAVVIACVGALAVSLFTTQQRTKEVGVRKALGATSR